MNKKRLCSPPRRKRVAAITAGMVGLLSGLMLSSALAAPAYAQTGQPVEVEEGLYTIAGVGSGNQLDVANGKQASGSNVQMEKNDTGLTQRWNVKKVGDHYMLLSAGTNYALDVYAGSKDNGANVWLYSKNGTEAQLWDFIQNEDGSYALRNVASGNVLDVYANSKSKGANVQVYKSNGSSAQGWKITKITRTVEDGLYQISSAVDNSKVLDVYAASTTNGAKVDLYGANGTIAQKWQVAYNEKTGFYSVAAACSSKMLEVPAASTTAGTKLSQYASNGTAAQQWAITQNSDGTVSFFSACCGLVIDVPAGKATNGQYLHTYSYNGTKAQQWVLTKTDLVSEGLYTFKSAVNQDYVLDVYAASRDQKAKLDVYKSNGTLAQKWLVSKLENGSYSIKSANSGLYLTDTNGALTHESQVTDAGSWVAKLGANGGVTFINKATGKAIDLYAGNAANGASVNTWSANSTAAQSWVLSTVKPIENGYYVLYNNSANNQVLDVYAGSLENGGRVQSHAYNGSGAQIWYVKSEGSNLYSLSNAQSELMLDVPNGTAVSGTKLQQYQSNGQNPQRWRIAIGDNGGLVFTSAVGNGDLALGIDGGKAASMTPAVISTRSVDDMSQSWTYAKASYSNVSYDAQDIWKDSNYINTIRKKVEKYGSKTNWVCVTDIDKCRFLAFHKEGGKWVCVRTVDCWVGRYRNGKSLTFSGVRKIYRQAPDLYNSDGHIIYKDGNGNRYDCAAWWSCFVDVTSNNWNDGYQISPGVFENGQGYHWAGDKSGSDRHVTTGCVCFTNINDAKWIYDNVDIGSTVINFASYDGDNLTDNR